MKFVITIEADENLIHALRFKTAEAIVNDVKKETDHPIILSITFEDTALEGIHVLGQ